MIIASDIHDRKGKSLMVSVLRPALERDRHRTLILSGDLTCGAKEGEYDRITQWLVELMEEGVNVILAVGNHDMSKSIGVARIPKEKGFRRHAALLDILECQQIVVDRMDEFDMIYMVGMDVFYCARSTHSKVYKGSRIKKKQLFWARGCLEYNGLLPENGYRLHLVTHQSLWHLPDDAHGHIHKRKRLVKNLLDPLGFVTAINGHNHRFDAAEREVKDLGFYLYHIQAPTLSSRTKGKFIPGYVQWDPEIPCSARMVKVEAGR